MGAIALDANVLIGFLNRDDAHHAEAHREVTAALTSGDGLLASATVYAETMVGPLRAGRGDEAEDFFRALAIEIRPIGTREAREAARLRAAHPSLRLPDALVVAVARLAGARLVTFDRRLARIVGAP